MILKNKIFIRVVALIILLFSFLMPDLSVVSSQSLQVLGIFLSGLILWLGDSTFWPSILVIFSLGLVDELGFSKIFINSFGNTTFIFLLFTFLFTYVVSKTTLLKRVATYFVTSSFAKKGPWHFITAFFFSVLLIGSFMSPTVLFVILLPFLEEIFKLLDIKKGEKIASVLMMGLAYTVSISSGMTPIAHVFSVLAISFYEEATSLTISNLDYMMIAVPVGILVTVFLILMFRFILKPNTDKLKNINLNHMKEELGKITKKEIIILFTFIFVVLLWIVPSVLENVKFFSIIKSYGIAFPPMLGVILFSLIKYDGQPLIKLEEAFTKGVPWSSLIMAAATLALGFALSSSEIGLKDALISNFGNYFNGLSPVILISIFVTWAALQTNLSSNMVTVTVVSQVAIPILLGTSEVSTPAVVCLIGIMGAFAFMTPPAMPHIALSANSGYTNTKELFRYGFIMMVVSVLLSISLGYTIGLNIF